MWTEDGLWIIVFHFPGGIATLSLSQWKGCICENDNDNIDNVAPAFYLEVIKDKFILMKNNVWDMYLDIYFPF